MLLANINMAGLEYGVRVSAPRLLGSLVTDIHQSLHHLYQPPVILSMSSQCLSFIFQKISAESKGSHLAVVRRIGELSRDKICRVAT